MVNQVNSKDSVLPSSLLDPSHEHPQKDVVERKRFRKCRSAPVNVIDLAPKEANGSTSTQSSESLLKSVHPSFRKIAAFLSLYLGVGVVVFYAIRHQISGKKTNSIVDAFYFCVVTLTSVGYGDLIPKSKLAILLSCAFVLLGMALMVLILSKGAEYLVEKQEALIVRALHIRNEQGPCDITKEIDTSKRYNKFVLVLIIMLILMIAGVLLLTLGEKLDFVDAFYCVCASITSLGYIDKCFSSMGARIFAVFWILTSTICLAQFFLCVAELHTEKKQKALVKRVLSRPVTNQDLEAADINNDGSVDVAEFALYKLKEMGKVTQEDLLLIMEEFQELDVDQSGTLSLCDIRLAQSSPRATQLTSIPERP